jgi:Mg2+ and Co2+ transporter CorA
MKIFTYVAIVLAVALIVFNIFQVNPSSPFEGQSTIALIGIVAGLCAILLLVLLMMSKKMVDKTHE